MVEITVRELARQTGINYQKLLYDVHAQRLPARRVGQRLMVDIDNEVIQSILRDPAAYEAQRDFTSRKKHAILYNNVTYESVAAMATALGISRETVYEWLRNGKAVTVPK